MGISYYTCHNCGKTFPDCEYYVRCDNCGTKWCDDECAEQDGYMPEHCTKYGATGDDLHDTRLDNECDSKHCDEDCEFFVDSTCGFCRCEQYEDSELLTKALSILHITREELVKRMEDRD